MEFTSVMKPSSHWMLAAGVILKPGDGPGKVPGILKGISFQENRNGNEGHGAGEEGRGGLNGDAQP
jgi:hypothetical protein